MQVALIEDDESFAQTIKAGLIQAGYEVEWLRDAAGAQRALESRSYRCVLLDLGLPDGSGEGLLRHLRSIRFTAGIIVTTANCQVGERIKVLDIGADDYLTKPFDLEELYARMRAVIRRTCLPEGPPVLRFGGLSLYPGDARVTFHHAPVTLSSREYLLLEAFLRNGDGILTRMQLKKAVYGGAGDLNSNAIEVYIHHLRKKFGAGLIRTVRGMGYRLGEFQGRERVPSTPAVKRRR